MSKHTDKSTPRNSSSGRYEKLLKGEITSHQYVNSLKQDAGSRRSSRAGRYSTARSGRRSASA